MKVCASVRRWCIWKRQWILSAQMFLTIDGFHGQCTCGFLPIVVDHECVDTILHTLAHSLQQVRGRVMQLDQKRVQRFALLFVPGIKLCNSVFVVEVEKSLLQHDGACAMHHEQENTRSTHSECGTL